MNHYYFVCFVCSFFSFFSFFDFFKQCTARREVIVDLSDGDCKEELRIKLNNENNSETEWFASYEDVLNEIENKLNNKNWTQSFGLFVKENNEHVSNLNDFINIFKNKEIIQLSIQVESC